MGRLATHLAAAVADADNLPPAKHLPQISLWDAFLAKEQNKAGPQRKETTQQKASKCLEPQWCDVRRDFKGRKIVVAHRGPCYRNATGGDGAGKGGTEDVKKGANGNRNGGAKGDEKNEEAKTEGGGNGGGGGKNGGGGGDEKKSQELTAEEDEKLKSLKATNTSWKNIAKEMGKPQKMLKDRWKEIEPDKDAGDGKDGKKGGDKKDEGGEKKADGKPAADEKKDEEQKKSNKKEKNAAKEEAKPKSNGGGGGGKNGEAKPSSKSGSDARFTMGEWVTLQEDDLFSFGELQLLSELIARYDTDRWQMVASRFYDKTGRRIHPDDVRQKFMQAWALG